MKTGFFLVGIGTAKLMAVVVLIWVGNHRWSQVFNQTAGEAEIQGGGTTHAPDSLSVVASNRVCLKEVAVGSSWVDWARACAAG